MIPRLTDEEIVTKWNIDTDNTTERNELESYKFGFRSAESIYTPQIEKLQGEIESIRKDLVEQMQKSGDYFAEKLTLGTELQQLIAKHERLVKGLKEIRWYDAKDIYEGDESMVGKDWIKRQDVILLTEEGNV